MGSLAQKGFTLLEILVALTIFAFVMVMASQGLNALLTFNEKSASTFTQDAKLHTVWAMITQDIIHLRARSAKDFLGGDIRAYTTELPDYDVQFIRGGVPAFVSSPGGMQLIGYRVVDDKLYRAVWPELDQFADSEPQETALIDGVSEIQFEQLNFVGEFENAWPPLNVGLPLNAIPKLIRVTIRLNNNTETWRFLPSSEMPVVSDIISSNTQDEADNNTDSNADSGSSTGGNNR